MRVNPLGVPNDMIDHRPAHSVLGPEPCVTPIGCCVFVADGVYLLPGQHSQMIIFASPDRHFHPPTKGRPSCSQVRRDDRLLVTSAETPLHLIGVVLVLVPDHDVPHLDGIQGFEIAAPRGVIVLPVVLEPESVLVVVVIGSSLS